MNTEGPEKRKIAADDLFTRAAECHQRGEVPEAERLYAQIVSDFPETPRAELARTVLSGLRREKIALLWSAAREARSQCDAPQAVKLYRTIIGEHPGTTEAQSAETEIGLTKEIQQLWNEALAFQANGDEVKALQRYQQLAERYPNSPEAENAGLFMAMIHQNQMMPRGEVTQEFKDQKDTPESLVSHLLSHRNAAGAAHPDEDPAKMIDALWGQAQTLEKDGNYEAAVIMYKKIVDSSSQGYRVRDARYRIEKCRETAEARQASYEQPDRWGLERDRKALLLRMLGSRKVIVPLAVAVIVMAAAVLIYRATRPQSWTDIMETTKRSVVVVRTASGAGTGFLISSNGQIITNAQVVGRERDVEVRLYSGMLKKADVVKVGTKLLDVALLKIDGAYEQYLPLSGEEECREGMEIRVLGAPMGIEYFMTKGMISHCNVARDGVRYIQTDTAISTGSTGGPCLNQQGAVVGLSTPIVLNSDVKSLNIILPQTVIRDFLEGKLTALEESLIRKEEDRARELEENRKKQFAAIDAINTRLQQVADAERKAYLGKVNDLLLRRRITAQQADLMVEQVDHGPSWSVTMSQWVQSLALKVAKEEIAEDSAVMLIKNQHRIQ